MPTWELSGFGDEIDSDPVVQVAVLTALGARHIEVRGAWGEGILDLTPDRLDALQDAIAERDMAVSAIASPVGKVDVALPVEHEVARLGTAIAAAHRLGTRLIRIFSFYRAPELAPEAVRDEVLVRMRALADLAEREGVVLLHENEKDIYGDVPHRVLDLIESVGSDALRVAWDSANFVQVGVRPFTDGYRMLRPHLAYVQVKDARAADGGVVVAGDGDGEVERTLRALAEDGYEGFVSLEPHLAMAGRAGGFAGPAEFGRAARALRAITDRIGVTLA